MVSDVLSDSAHEIRKYLKDYPGYYDDIKPRLEKLLTEMDALRIELDTPPKD